MNHNRREICIGGRMVDLPRIVEFVRKTTEEAGVDEAAQFDLQLAVEEACTNIIEHAYGGQGGTFEVCLEILGSDVCITVRDQGVAFDPGTVPRPDLGRPLEERQVGGLGLYLMEQLMDEVRFTFASEGNTLVMIKHNCIAGPEQDQGA